MARVRGLAAPAAIAFAAVLLSTAASCGGKGPEPAPGPTGGSGPSGPTGGSGPSAPPSGGGSGGGGTDGGSPAGSGGSGGTTGGGDGGGGTAGGGSGGGSGSGGADACSGLGATPDAGRALRFDTGTHASCWRATSSPNGQLAFGIMTGGAQVRFLLFPPDGSAQQGEIPAIQPNGFAELDPSFHWTRAGWAGLVHDPPPAIALRSFDTRGSVLGTSRDLAVSSAPDPHGGTVIIASSSAAGSQGAPMLEWLDAQGTVLRTVLLDDHPTMLLIAWGTNHVLTLVPGPASLRARWYDGAGAPLTPWFEAGQAIDASRATMHLLLDGTIALGDGDAWRGVFRDGVAAIDPPPGWLAARPRTRLATIRNGRAYAVLPIPSGPQSTGTGGQSAFEIVTASGDSCGTVTLPAPPVEAGVTRSPTALDVGQDGTVLQTETLLGNALGNGVHGEFRWWAALLE